MPPMELETQTTEQLPDSTGTTSAGITPETPTEDSAGFAAGFNRIKNGPESLVEEKPIAETIPVAEPPPATEPPPQQLFGMTEEQFRNELSRVSALEQHVRKVTDDINGRYGRLKQVIDGLQQATPAGEPVELTVDDLAALKGEYPELAGMVAKDLNTALKKAGRVGTGAVQIQGIDPETFDRVMNERIGVTAQQLQQQFDQRLSIAVLDMRHPDRIQVTETPEWGNWLKTKPAEYKQTLETTWDLNVVSKGLDDFKAWRADQEKSKRRVESALQPTNGATTAPPALPNPSASFSKGYYKAKGIQA